MIVIIVGKTERELDFAVRLVEKIMDRGIKHMGREDHLVEVRYQLAGRDDVMPWDTGFIHDSDLSLLQSLGYKIKLMSPCDRCRCW